MQIKIIALLLAGLTLAPAAEEKAPNGGRIIAGVTPHAEFLVTKDRKVEIRFLEAGHVIAPSDQVVTATTGDRSSPTKLVFTRDGDKLVSDKALPEGKELPLVLQVRTKAGDKAVTEKFNVNLARCPVCKLSEYACSCDHGK